MPAKKKTATLTAAEVREKIGDFQKEVAVELPDSVLHGELSELTKRVKEFAKEKGITGTLSIRKARVKKKNNWRSSRWVAGRYEYYYGTHSVIVTCVVGSRPFTDEELEGTDGKRVLASMARAEKAKAKDVARIKQLAAKHGITVPV